MLQVLHCDEQAFEVLKRILSRGLEHDLSPHLDAPSLERRVYLFARPGSEIFT